MADKIFISYRRSEAIKDARSLYERLAREFGQDRVFIDLDGIEPGEDFVALLRRQLDGCGALIVVIGPKWAAERRLHNEYDFVRLEVGTSLERGIKVFPVLVNGALPPESADLPDILHPLLSRQAIVLDDRKFDADVAILCRAVRKAIDKRASLGAESIQADTVACSSPIEATFDADKRASPSASKSGRLGSTLQWMRSGAGVWLLGSILLAYAIRLATASPESGVLAGLLGAVGLTVFHCRRPAGAWSLQRDVGLLWVGTALVTQAIGAILFLWVVTAAICGAVLHFMARKAPGDRAG